MLEKNERTREILTRRSSSVVQVVTEEITTMSGQFKLLGFVYVKIRSQREQSRYYTEHLDQISVVLRFWNMNSWLSAKIEDH